MGKKVIEIKKDEKEPVVEETISKAEYRKIIEAYRIQSPDKAKRKEPYFQAKLASL